MADIRKLLPPDTSADCSFTVCTDGLRPNTVYRINNDFFKGMSPLFFKDAVRFVVSFQGILNRDHGTKHTTMLYLDVTESDDFWLQYCMSEGKTFHGVDVVDLPDMDAFFTTFAPQLAACGVILWDSAVPATANVAATICGLDGYLPVQFNEANDSFCALVKAKDLEVKQSLVGMFGKNGTAYTNDFVTCGSAKNDAYRWAYDRYFNRCSSRYIAYILDGAGCVEGTPFFEYANSPFMNCLYNHDYYLARRCFFFDLTCIDVERPCDDPEQPLGTDLATLKMILKGRYDRAEGGFGQILGFPPWWVKYTTSKGQGSLWPTTVEWIYVTLVTAYNLAKEADAAMPCSMSNASFYCRYQSNFTEYHNPRPKVKKTFDPKTKYYTFYGGDYDSAAWLKMHVRNFWRDEARGSLPINWAFNPNLSERAPMVFDYVHENLSDNDFFTAGDSGAGYVIPSALFAGQSIRELPDGADAWAEYCDKYYRAFDLDTTGFIINGFYPVTPDVYELFARFSPVGNFHNGCNASELMANYNGTPFVYMHNGVSGKPDQLERGVKAMYEHMFGTMKDYNFSGYRNVCDSPSDTKRIVEAFQKYAKEQNPDYNYEYVDFYTFFDLVKQSGQSENK